MHSIHTDNMAELKVVPLYPIQSILAAIILNFFIIRSTKFSLMYIMLT